MSEVSQPPASPFEALENLRDHVGGDVDTLKVNLLNNVALCHLKTENFDKAVEACEDALKIDSRSFKAGPFLGSAAEVSSVFVIGVCRRSRRGPWWQR